MGDAQTFTQLGFGLSALLIVWITTKYFIDAITKKDDYIKSLVEGFQARTADFNTTINNHIDHQTAQALRETEALQSLTTAINGLQQQLNSDARSSTKRNALTDKRDGY